jgi:hypothetical protein
LICKSKENRVHDIGNESQSSALIMYRDYTADIGSGKNWSEMFNKNNEFEYRKNSVIDVEVDCENKTIYFFINKKQCPYYISDISSFPLLFGFTSFRSPIIEVVLLFKMHRSSSFVNSSVLCKPVKCVSIYLLYLCINYFFVDFLLLFIFF